jgi:membrane-associated protease RseP (regulator of RpoE activity)
MELIFWIAVILAFIFGGTYIVKRTTKAQTVGKAISVVKTERFNKSMDGLAKHERTLNIVTDLGLLLGFGAIAVDCLYGRKHSMGKRLAIFIISLPLFYFLIEVLSFVFPLFGGFFTNPFIEEYTVLIKALFIVFGLSGLIVGFLGGYAIYVIQNLFAGQHVCPGVAPIIPGVQLPNVPFVVPVHAWLSFLIILVIHEGMHGVLMRKIGLKIKSTGVLLIGLLPIGAFVEPDEKKLAKKPARDQLRVYSAGPSSNLFASMIIPYLMLFSLLFIVNPLTAEWILEVKQNSIQAVVIDRVPENTELCGQFYENPAFGRLEEGMQIKKIGRYTIISGAGAATALANTLSENPKAEFQMQVLDKEGKELDIAMTPNELGIVQFGVEEIPNPDYDVPQEYLTYTALAGFMNSFLTWLVLLNLLIAIGNFLPLDPLDGGKIAKILLLPYFGFMGMNKQDTEKLIGRLMVWVIGILLLINVLPMFL